VRRLRLAWGNARGRQRSYTDKSSDDRSLKWERWFGCGVGPRKSSLSMSRFSELAHSCCGPFRLLKEN